MRHIFRQKKNNAMTEEQITQAVARQMFPQTDWESETLGYLTCPGVQLHTTSDGRKDCRITINDGIAPTVHCCHDSCRAEIEKINHQFRSAIGKLKTATAGQLKKVAQVVSASQKSYTINTTPKKQVEIVKKRLEPVELPQPMKDGQRLHLQTCFEPAELVGIVRGANETGEVKTKGFLQNPEPIEDWEYGTFIRVNPMNPDGFGDRDVASFRHVLLECDKTSLELQWAAFLASNLPISVAVFSGKRSIHAWVRVDAKNEQEYRERAKMAANAVDQFEGIEVDRAVLNPSRFSRLAGMTRFDQRQDLLAIKIGATNWESWANATVNQQATVAESKLDEVKPLLENRFFYKKHGKDFLYWHPNGKVVPLTQESTKLFLADELGEDCDKKAITTRLKDIMVNHALDYDGPLPGYRIGVHEERGSLLFSTSEPKVLEGVPPADATPGVGWETIYQLLQGLFVQSDNFVPLGHFMATLKQSRDCLRLALQGYGDTRQVRSGQATVLCGPKACGKSFLMNHVISPLLGGRSQDAHKAFSSGSEGFNGELLGGEVWIVDDKEHASDIRTRRQFGASIKSMLYSGLVGFHAKHKTQITIRPFARLFILCNDQDDAVKVLPPLTTDIQDKIHLFRCGFTAPAMETKSNADWEAYGERIKSELPAFAGWLDQLKIADRFLDNRSGVACYQDPYVVNLLASQAPEHELAQLLVQALEMGILRNHGAMRASSILEDLRKNDTLQPLAKNILHDDAAILSRYLGRIANDSNRYETEMGLRVAKGRVTRPICEWEIELAN